MESMTNARTCCPGAGGLQVRRRRRCSTHGHDGLSARSTNAAWVELDRALQRASLTREEQDAFSASPQRPRGAEERLFDDEVVRSRSRSAGRPGHGHERRGRPRRTPPPSLLGKLRPRSPRTARSPPARPRRSPTAAPRSW
jgi:hypothetical protein